MNSEQSVREKHNEYLFDAVKNFYKEPLVITDGKGFHVYDCNGEKYLDFFFIYFR